MKNLLILLSIAFVSFNINNVNVCEEDDYAEVEEWFNNFDEIAF